MKTLRLTLILLMIANLLTAQQNDLRYTNNETVPFGIVQKIESKVLGETRIINIYLPQGYHPDSAATYPCIYLLDGSAHEDYPHIAGLVQFMNMYNLMPKSIIVGIANVDRYRDFSYPSNNKKDIKRLPTSGGSEKFIKFLETELRPFVHSTYKTNQHNTIIGQSLGGLLATEILMNKHQLFDDYIIVSPSLWWDDKKLVEAAHEHFKSNQDLNKRIYISLGQEPPVMHEVADKLVDAIKSSGNKNIKLYYEPILDEDHATILHSAVYNAFKRLNTKSAKR